MGFDGVRTEYVDLVEADIIEPTKVMRIVQENSVSVVSLRLLTEATLTEAPEKEEESSGDGYDTDAITHVMGCTSHLPGDLILAGIDGVS